MTASDFEMRVSLPAEARFAGLMRELAAHAARYAGCPEQDAERYAMAVEQNVAACLASPTAGAEARVILRRGAGPIEVLIACQGSFAAATRDGAITVGWTREQGTAMCRVAIDL